MRADASAFLVRSAPSDVPLAIRKSLRHGPASINRLPDHRPGLSPLLGPRQPGPRDSEGKGGRAWFLRTAVPLPFRPTLWLGGLPPLNVRRGPGRPGRGGSSWTQKASNWVGDGGPTPAGVEANPGSSLSRLVGPMLLVQSRPLWLRFPLYRLTALGQPNNPV